MTLGFFFCSVKMNCTRYQTDQFQVPKIHVPVELWNSLGLIPGQWIHIIASDAVTYCRSYPLYIYSSQHNGDPSDIQRQLPQVRYSQIISRGLTEKETALFTIENTSESIIRAWKIKLPHASQCSVQYSHSDLHSNVPGMLNVMTEVTSN